MLKKIFKKEAAKPPVLSSRSTVLSNGLELDCLPEELLRQVFSYLSPEDLCAFCRVNELWRSIVEEDAMWRRHIPEKPVGVYKKDTPLKRVRCSLLRPPRLTLCRSTRMNSAGAARGLPSNPTSRKGSASSVRSP